jgi:hypothetical protein
MNTNIEMRYKITERTLENYVLQIGYPFAIVLIKSQF